jgi:VanZ family protein
MCIFNTTSVYLYSVAVSIFYAFTDEFHQLFVTGRTGQFIDIGIDMIGVLIGVLVFYIYGLLVKVRRLGKNS